MIFCLEAAIIGALAGAVGYLVGFGASLKTLEFLTLADGARPVFSIAQLVFCASVFPVITILAALYPAWRGASVEPSQALVSL
jgi:putative ABC transport system permease protein